jgi:multidrug efflux pump
MISRFFIDRPIFAAVLSIVLVLAGSLALVQLPIAQYPEITPPTVSVSCSFPGATASLVQQAVAAPIEQVVNGVEDMLYMSSQCTNAGSYGLTVTFKPGVKVNMAQVRVQNRVQLALASLPETVVRGGLTVRKRSPDQLLTVNLFSPDGSRDQLYLSNYATLRLKDQIARVDGVGDISISGQKDYAMRIWLDPDELASRGLMASEVADALRDENAEAVLGEVGAPPVPAGIDFQYSMGADGMLASAEEFGDVVVKTGRDGSIVRLRDIARVELAAQSLDTACVLDGKPSAGLSIYQSPGANALAVGAAVRAKMDELKALFPPGIDYAIVQDVTPFISESVAEVLKALRDAVILVALVVLVFLQSWRSTVIPLVAIPVAIVGTFVVMAAVGLSLNNLSLFGLVLAIGIVVDDAIVVVENVERWLEHGLAPREAARKAMDEVTGPVIAVALVLCAVFVPCAFISGITGAFFRQFAITIAVSTVISAFNSLTLSPALAALLLRRREPGAREDLFTRLLEATLGWFFRGFNRLFAASTSAYTAVVGRLLRVSALVLVLYGGLLVLTWWGVTRLPVGFIPQQDKGRLMANIQLPDSSSLERTTAVVARVDAIARATKGVAHTMGMIGTSSLAGGTGSNVATLYIVLAPFEERRDPSLSANALIAELKRKFAHEIREAEVQVLGAAPVDGLGNAGGFKLQVEDRGDFGLAGLQGQVDSIIEKAKHDPRLTGVVATFRAGTPGLVVSVDREKCKAIGVPLGTVFSALQVYLGGYGVNQFVLFGRTWNVVVAADAEHRMQPEDVGRLTVRSDAGKVVPLGTLVRVDYASAPLFITRYNMYPTVSVNGSAAPGVSSGDAIAIMDALCESGLPPRVGSEWTDLAFMQIQAGNTGMYVLLLSVVLVFLALAAQYESWSLPLSVVLVVPLCILCAAAGVAIASMDLNVFTQIGFVVLIGLASKNAILIVEFARQQRLAGAAGREATLEACRLRLRPIMMTSFAFILGVVPLMIASGAGAEMRRTLGTAVFSGMLGVTMFGIFFTPVFFYVIDRASGPAPRAASDVRPQEHDPHGVASG